MVSDVVVVEVILMVEVVAVVAVVIVVLVFMKQTKKLTNTAFNEIHIGTRLKKRFFFIYSGVNTTIFILFFKIAANDVKNQKFQRQNCK